jgi:KRAB domain-containing zinc finger protein
MDPTKIENEKIKRFWCDVCDYSSNQRSNLKTHSNAVHLGKKGFKCDICDQAFSQKGSLKKHVNVVHKNITRYSCDLCDFSSYYRANLETHSKSVHLGRKTSSVTSVTSLSHKKALSICM